ncbi:hypothetical protein GQ42DRAFT_24651 [Ramicandelaber brevisporus]|nr:hypothetical protein GQ42DRAFT_24646 [Ramicandelaber brevisporus]KAI8869745.1 hypothetical protein GQ42DRAFT_24651 [Ramicandelaber brevisporus]
MRRSVQQLLHFTSTVAVSSTRLALAGCNIQIIQTQLLLTCEGYSATEPIHAYTSCPYSSLNYPELFRLISSDLMTIFCTMTLLFRVYIRQT